MSKTRSGKSAKSDPCGICQVIFTSSDDMMMFCDRCEKLICLQCAQITKSQYEFFTAEDNRNISHLWFCSNCLTPAATSVKTDNSIEEKCKVFFKKFDDKYKSEIANIKKDIAGIQKEIVDSKGTTSQEVEELQKQLSDHKEQVDDKLKEIGALDVKAEIKKEVKAAMDNSTESAINEIKEREDRKLNLICFNIEESSKDSGEERKQEDLNTITSILTELQVKAHVANPVRLGKKTAESKRPLRFTVSSVQDRNSVLRASSNLKKSAKFSEAVLSKDLTPLERNFRKDLVKLKKQKQEETNATGGTVEWVIRNNRVVPKDPPQTVQK